MTGEDLKLLLGTGASTFDCLVVYRYFSENGQHRQYEFPVTVSAACHLLEFLKQFVHWTSFQATDEKHLARAHALVALIERSGLCSETNRSRYLVSPPL